MAISEDALRRLCHLLNCPYHADLLSALALSHFQAWKPIAEQAARDGDNHAGEIAQLLQSLAAETGNAQCRALAYWISGNIHFRLGENRIAMAHFDEAENLYLQNGESLNAARMGVGKIATFMELGEFTQAIQFGTGVLAELQRSDHPEDAARAAGAYDNLGAAHEGLGEYEEALDCFRHKLRWFNLRHDAENAQAEIASALSNIGTIQTYLGKYIEAAKAFARARDWLERFPDDAECMTDMARLDSQWLWLETLRRSNEAIVERAITRAFDSRERVPNAKIRLRALGLTPLTAINWWININRYERVELAKLLELRVAFEQSGLWHEYCLATLLVGRLALEKDGDGQLAQDYFRQILTQAKAAKNPYLVYLAKVWIARALRQLQQPEAAIAELEDGLNLIERGAQTLASLANQAGYFEDKLIGYRDLIAIHVDANNVEAAFAAIERSKAKTLADLLHKQASDAAHSTTSDVSTGAMHAAFDNLESVRAVLEDGTLAIDCTILDGRVWAVVFSKQLSPRLVALGKLPSRTDWSELLQSIVAVQSLRQQTSTALTADAIAQQIHRSQIYLSQWYDEIIRPLRSYIQSHTSLLISPDDLLNLFPFECLFDSTDKRYLVESHEIVLTPSLQVWARIQNDARKTHAQDPGAPIALSMGHSAREGVPNVLPCTVEEAKIVGTLLNRSANSPHVYVEAQATKTAFRRDAPSAGFIHLAVHGRFRQDTPALSYVELADGRLFMSEVATMQLDGAQVVLSACDSAHGRLTGNEVLGLPWAFLCAGARAVAATFWPVEDESTLTFMTCVARHLGEGKLLARSLAAAKREFIGAQTLLQRHPYFWGGMGLFCGSFD